MESKNSHRNSWNKIHKHKHTCRSERSNYPGNKLQIRKKNENKSSKTYLLTSDKRFKLSCGKHCIAYDLNLDKQNVEQCCNTLWEKLNLQLLIFYRFTSAPKISGVLPKFRHENALSRQNIICKMTLTARCNVKMFIPKSLTFISRHIVGKLHLKTFKNEEFQK